MKIEEKEALIKDKEEKIKELKRELADLKGSNTFSEYITETMLHICGGFTINGEYQGIEIMEFSFLPNEWQHIRLLGKELFQPKHYGLKRYCIKDMTEDEKKVAARMADEMIVIWNKYVKEVYGSEEK